MVTTYAATNATEPDVDLVLKVKVTDLGPIRDIRSIIDSIQQTHPDLKIRLARRKCNGNRDGKKRKRQRRHG